MDIVDVLKKLDAEKVKDLHEAANQFLTVVEDYPPMTPSDLIHASSILCFCPRREVIRIQKNITESRTIEAKLSKTFKMGRAFEKMYRDDVLGEMKNVLIGKWRCMSCGFIPEAMNGSARYPKPKDACPRCHEEVLWTYQEEEKIDESTNIRGHNDGFLYWNSDYAILELKTVNNNRFGMVKKKGPFDDHVAQAQAYMRLYGYKKAVIWYFNKDTSDDLTFWLDYDQQYASLLFDRGYALKEFFVTGKIPPRICINKECEKATACAHAAVCFDEMKEP